MNNDIELSGITSEDYFGSALDTIVRSDDTRYDHILHYTDLAGLQGIVASGFIRTMTQPDADEYLELAKVKMVWGSANPIFEPVCCASDGIIGHYLEAFIDPEENIDAVRIEVTTSIMYEWSSFMISHGIDGFYTANLARNDMTFGSDPHDWFVAGGPVGIDKFVSVEIWDGKYWIPLGESSDYRAISLAKLLPSHLSQRTDRSGAGNDTLDLIRAQGGYDRVYYAESEYEYHACMQDDIYTGAYDILTTKRFLNNSFRILQALLALPSAEADTIIAQYGESALRDLRDNPAFARFVRNRFEEKIPGVFDRVPAGHP